MTFRVGQKVVCIQRKWAELTFGEAAPKFGEVYTIRDMGVDDGGELMLRFEEIVNPCQIYRQGNLECRFWAARFRPLIARETDISIFKRMLTPSQKELANAD